MYNSDVYFQEFRLADLGIPWYSRTVVRISQGYRTGTTAAVVPTCTAVVPTCINYGTLLPSGLRKRGIVVLYTVRWDGLLDDGRGGEASSIIIHHYIWHSTVRK